MSAKLSFKKRSRQDPPAPPQAASPAVAHPAHTVSGIWIDPLGRIATRSIQLLVVLILASAVVYSLLKLSVIALPILIALILSCALWPLVRLLRKVMSPLLAAWSVFLGSLLVLGGIGTALVYSVLAEWQTLVDKGVEGFNKLQGMLNQLPWNISEEQIDDAVNQVTGFLTSSQFGAGALSGLSAAGNFFTGLALLLVILFFFLKDGDKIWGFYLSWMPDHQMHRWLSTGARTVETLGGYMRGTATVAAVDAIGITVALLVLRVPLAIPLGVVVFMSSFIPLVGATFAGILATLIALVTNGPVVALIVLGAVIVVNQLEGNFLQPVVMAHALNLHALVILLSLAAGTVLGGLVGAVLAVPLTAVAWAIVKIWSDRDLPGLDPGAASEKKETPEDVTPEQLLAHAEAAAAAKAQDANAARAAASESTLDRPKGS
ncbi:AI-2E family transporter [Paeniglutamicibacter sp. ABSL32-1]|uniref:AI-2E family transporter n=1 Tax=Paeniglutamicibacter quisquiliarum TaxID=2849498 RepID=UPI001C2D8733|nr:AI-2E family transporter [Paeniglutamicibacter quisquiliarum]MBV1778170.1 AI-2E family transporter [Paeniglutamicibacter quisquiliarum]